MKKLVVVAILALGVGVGVADENVAVEELTCTYSNYLPYIYDIEKCFAKGDEAYKQGKFDEAKRYWAQSLYLSSLGIKGNWENGNYDWADTQTIIDYLYGVNGEYVLNEKPSDRTRARLLAEAGCGKRIYRVKDDYHNDKYEYVEKRPVASYCEVLGDIYRDGLGVSKDYKKALQYYKTACENPTSEYHELIRAGGGPSSDSTTYYCEGLGNMYYHGYGVKQDYKMAKKYWAQTRTESRANGYPVEGVFLMERTISGRYNERIDKYYRLNDFVAARLWAEVGCDEFLDSTSCKILGDIYSQGKGVVANQNTANAYYAKYKQYEQIEQEYDKCVYGSYDSYYEECLLKVSLKACKLGKKMACETAKSYEQIVEIIEDRERRRREENPTAYKEAIEAKKKVKERIEAEEKEAEKNTEF